jgi:C-terminal processing protease CtpA/Prc
MKLTLIFFILLSTTISFGQNADITIQNREELLNKITKIIKDNYISSDIATKTESLLNSEIKLGAFNNLTNEEFALKLTTYLRNVTKDKHFYIKYLSNYRPERNKVSDKKEEALNNISNSLENFGFEDVKRLEGNIGYINFKGFAEPKSSEIALASAMNFVSNTNSLIIDLRENRGGDNGMVLLFCSYFLKSKTRIYDTYFRNQNKIVANWTKATVKGKKYLNKNVFILTSKNSFSASEGLAYVLQSNGIAKVIGEQTGGAANPVDEFIIENKWLVVVPVGKVTTTLTKTNWEQIGVTPDEKIEAKNALTKAHALALKEVLRNNVRTELSETEIMKLIRVLENEL